MKDVLKELLATAKALVTAPLVTLVCLPGVALVLSAFIDYKGWSNVGFAVTPNAWRLGIGLTLIAVSVILYLLASPHK